MVVAKYFANIVRILVTNVCLEDKQIEYEVVVSRKQHSVDPSRTVVIRELNDNADYLLDFIKWALKVEEESQYQFSNRLCAKKDYGTVLVAVRLLEVLAVAFVHR